MRGLSSEKLKYKSHLPYAIPRLGMGLSVFSPLNQWRGCLEKFWNITLIVWKTQLRNMKGLWCRVWLRPQDLEFEKPVGHSRARVLLMALASGGAAPSLPKATQGKAEGYGSTSLGVEDPHLTQRSHLGSTEWLENSTRFLYAEIELYLPGSGSWDTGAPPGPTENLPLLLPKSQYSQSMCTTCADQFSSISAALLCVWSLQTQLFYLFIKYILGYCEV